MEEKRKTAHVTLIGIGMGTADTLTLEGERVIREADVLIGAKRMLDLYSPFRCEPEDAAGSSSIEHKRPVSEKTERADKLAEGKRKKDCFAAYRPDEICAYIETLPVGTRAAVLLSGDAGFYSGAKKLLKRLPEDTEVIGGISSLSFFCSRLKTDWEDVCPVSLHGRDCNVIGLLKEHPRLFAITGSRTAVSEVCRKLVYYGMGETAVSVGERLSYPDEKITIARAKDLTGYETDPLSVMLLELEKEEPGGSVDPGLAGDRKIEENVPPIHSDGVCPVLQEEGKKEEGNVNFICSDNGCPVLQEEDEKKEKNLKTPEKKGFSGGKPGYGSIPDDGFCRGNVPMTKEEVRCISVSKLRLRRDSIVYDIGAGTGSVSVEAADLAVLGKVYSIERKEEALSLIEKNRQRFAVDNLVPVPGEAPDALKELEAPDCAFVGGSGGNLRAILNCLLDKNPSVRVVINAISPETVSEVLAALKKLPFTEPEIVSVSIAKAKKAGSHHLMMGQNPVYIISADGTGRKRV